RKLLWQALIPSQARGRLAVDIDWDQLAASYEMSGGYIKNAVIRAAGMAADEGEVSAMRHPLLAASRVYEEVGEGVDTRGAGARGAQAGGLGAPSRSKT